MNAKSRVISDPPKLKVFIVDDDEAIRSSLSRALGQRSYLVESHASAESFLARYQGEPGCLILDYGMPDMDGLQLQAHLKKAEVSLPVIFVTGHGGVPESVQAIKAGAIDFLEKPFRQQVLVDRIEAAFEIERRRLEAEDDARLHRARFERLTAREQEIVDWIVANPGEVTSKDIALRLGISPRTVDHHRARILEKLEVKSVVEVIALLRGG